MLRVVCPFTPQLWLVLINRPWRDGTLSWRWHIASAYSIWTYDLMIVSRTLHGHMVRCEKKNLQLTQKKICWHYIMHACYSVIVRHQEDYVRMLLLFSSVSSCWKVHPCLTRKPAIAILSNNESTGWLLRAMRHWMTCLKYVWSPLNLACWYRTLVSFWLLQVALTFPVWSVV